MLGVEANLWGMTNTPQHIGRAIDDSSLVGPDREGTPWERVMPRQVKPADWFRFEQSMA